MSGRRRKLGTGTARALVACGGVATSAAIGILINVLTDSPGWAVSIGLLLAVVAAGTIAVWGTRLADGDDGPQGRGDDDGPVSTSRQRVRRVDGDVTGVDVADGAGPAAVRSEQEIDEVGRGGRLTGIHYRRS